jgi:anti-sigma factor RsiW
MDRKILKLLYRSLDLMLKEKDQRRLDRALGESPELRQHQAELLAIRRAIADGAVRSFRPQFVERAMNRIQSGGDSAAYEDVLFGAYRAVFRRAAVVGLVILAVLVSYNIMHKELLPQDTIFYVSDLTIGKILQVPIF